MKVAMRHNVVAMAAMVFPMIILAVACSKSAPPEGTEPTPPAPTAQPEGAPAGQPPAQEGAAAGDAAKQAATIFAERCATCHGVTGKGDGAAAAALNPKPRNYSDPAWQASVKDDELAKIIVEGGTAVGKSALMPANPDLKDKPEVVAELVKVVRSFKGK